MWALLCQALALDRNASRSCFARFNYTHRTKEQWVNRPLRKALHKDFSVELNEKIKKKNGDLLFIVQSSWTNTLYSQTHQSTHSKWSQFNSTLWLGKLEGAKMRNIDQEELQAFQQLGRERKSKNYYYLVVGHINLNQHRPRLPKVQCVSLLSAKKK